MISIEDFAKKTTDIKIKTPSGDVVNLTVNLNAITPSNRAKYFPDDAVDVLECMREFLPIIIQKWDIKIHDDDDDFAPIEQDVLEMLPDRFVVILYEKIMEASSKLTGELIN